MAVGLLIALIGLALVLRTIKGGLATKLHGVVS